MNPPFRLSFLIVTIMLQRFFGTVAAKGTTVRHIVMFSFKDGTSKREIAKIKSGLLDLPKRIPVITDYELGCDLNLEGGQTHPAGKNRILSWTACFDSVKDYEKYDQHEAHKEFLGLLKPHVLPGSRSAIQYKVKDN
jgi:hypothetical protein